ncbi:8-oxo-dGTP diphosphatase [Virgibacillus sp. 179-BFC.A HS]|uniref:8-oxo-dGTP diphosphatase n=1 Tax=Tigheibacillus jepli TaxID=3035914 RepID=A0ABU5CFL8_9BACI|nr:8-oxo-dGTP diphosphatase [Virgibacillus sp. 179-BFC.A HS]MDY0405123.1 8-oxo-dGTP diphosphatase [Virgibacillus sp. 179-BFC.A HS]
MQRVANCILEYNEQILLIKKPSRGWYAMPGGKMEQGETIKEAAVREYWEETGLHLIQPRLAGVFTFNIYEQDHLEKEWMMFTFACKSHEGMLNEYCREGELKWKPRNEILTLPMAKGDKQIFEHVLASEDILYGSFQYTSDYQLLDFRLETQ